MALFQHCFVFYFILPLKLLDGNISIVIPFVLKDLNIGGPHWTETIGIGSSHAPLGKS